MTAATALPLSPSPSEATRRGSSPRPPARHDQRLVEHDRRDSSWREEQAELLHQLRMAKAEIASLQTKLGAKAGVAPFNSSSSRKSSALPSEAHDAADAVATASATRQSPHRSASARDTAASSGSGPQRAVRTATEYAAKTSGNSPRRPDADPSYEGASTVAMGRALLGSELAPLANEPRLGNDSTLPPTSGDTIRDPSPSSRPADTINGGLRPPSPSPPRPRSPSSASNPFFGSSGASRERLSKSATSAQSGSGKVISSLQSDLLQTRTALESTRGQLRLSQRAVDFLGRQNEDLKETKERLTSEIEALTRQITRKERLQEEALARARTAEGALAALQKEHGDFKSGVKRKVKELEDGAKMAEETKTRTEREYLALRDGVRVMQDGWKEDLRWLRDDLSRSQKLLELKSMTFSSLLETRTSLASSTGDSLAHLQSTHGRFVEQHDVAITTALSDLRLVEQSQQGDQRAAQELRGELLRLRRAMAQHAENEHPERVMPVPMQEPEERPP